MNANLKGWYLVSYRFQSSKYCWTLSLVCCCSSRPSIFVHIRHIPVRIYSLVFCNLSLFLFHIFYIVFHILNIGLACSFIKNEISIKMIVKLFVFFHPFYGGMGCFSAEFTYYYPIFLAPSDRPCFSLRIVGFSALHSEFLGRTVSVSLCHLFFFFLS